MHIFEINLYVTSATSSVVDYQLTRANRCISGPCAISFTCSSQIPACMIISSRASVSYNGVVLGFC